MDDGIKNQLQIILIKKMFVKNALKQLQKMMELTGKNYEKEINEVLDQLNALEKYEAELKRRK